MLLLAAEKNNSSKRKSTYGLRPPAAGEHRLGVVSAPDLDLAGF